MAPTAVIETLNRYFDCVMPPVVQRGGDVMEIMGDGYWRSSMKVLRAGLTRPVAGRSRRPRKGIEAIARSNLSVPEAHLS